MRVVLEVGELYWQGGIESQIEQSHTLSVEEELAEWSLRGFVW